MLIYDDAGDYAALQAADKIAATTARRMISGLDLKYQKGLRSVV